MPAEPFVAHASVVAERVGSHHQIRAKVALMYPKECPPADSTGSTVRCRTVGRKLGRWPIGSNEPLSGLKCGSTVIRAFCPPPAEQHLNAWTCTVDRAWDRVSVSLSDSARARTVTSRRARPARARGDGDRPMSGALEPRR